MATLSSLDKSDHMLYTNISELQFKDKRTNDLQYIYQMSQSINNCRIDRGDELKLFKDIYENKVAICNSCTDTRGGNYVGCEPSLPCYTYNNAYKEIQNLETRPEYSKYYLNEFLLTPCPKPTYKNYIVCGEDRCCSKRHQLFNNMTKRRDITGQE